MKKVKVLVVIGAMCAILLLGVHLKGIIAQEAGHGEIPVFGGAIAQEAGHGEIPVFGGIIAQEAGHGEIPVFGGATA